MLDPETDYSELEAAAYKRWPGLVSADGSATDALRREMGGGQAEATPRRRTRAITEMGVEFSAAAADGDADATLADEQNRIDREVVIRGSAPVFRISKGAIDWDNAVVGQAFWKQRLDEVEAKLKPRYNAIGRIEATLSALGSEALGTAWLIDPEVIVTNAHVARYFAQASDSGWRFRSQQGFDDRPMSASLDIGEDANSSGELHEILQVLYVSPTRDPDIAFLRIAPGVAAKPIDCFLGPLPERPDVAVIGYPERDETVDIRDLERFFGDIWGWKRFAPGILGQVGPGAVRHLCNTLGGNSGSPVLDLGTGDLIGLHYGGIPDRQNPVNYALPAQVVFRMLNDLRAAGPIQPEVYMAATHSSYGLPSAAGAASIQIPLTLTISLSINGAAANVTLDPSVAAKAGAAERAEASLEAAVAKAWHAFAARGDVLNVRAGWKVTGGVITKTPAIVVSVREKNPVDELAASGRLPLPASFAGIPIDVTAASVEDLLEDDDVFAEAARARRVPYRMRPELMPKELNTEMNVVISPGPDAGSGMLLDFLGKTASGLTVGMYEFTAPHIRDGMIAAMDGEKELAMVLQKGESIGGNGAKKHDITDEQMVSELRAALGGRFANQWSATAIHPYYHIKVAAQDDEALWLSSGSWQSSNQPLALRKGAHANHNREMHVIVANADVAKLFRQHVEKDATAAQAAFADEAVTLEPLFWVPDQEPALVTEAAAPAFFNELRIDRKLRMLPLLTPDNYSENLLELIQGATKSILFHNQSFAIAKTRATSFEALLAALKRKQLDSAIDVRIILRGNEGVIDARDSIEKMQSYGFVVDPDHVRIQPKLHNKMWLFDGEHSVIGSHNFTNQGTTINRDASLIFYDDEEIAGYCTRLFEHDWDRLADRKLNERRRGVTRARRGERPPPGMRAVTAAELIG